eukprot:CAMPEP_0180504534 /NCGR_PEP_ID=MMETSP1036_2-20121128/46786_1 /TAXON_ID=632150 /ORGANISM="Azadinium spinosum, Strain 3D9" /LENGTH=365 /DNA_ID=CAMNT_0022513973 /DNA_START=9 /DNA_END=1106 /DNA_ORIENTATION=-
MPGGGGASLDASAPPFVPSASSGLPAAAQAPKVPASGPSALLLPGVRRRQVPSPLSDEAVAEDEFDAMSLGSDAVSSLCDEDEEDATEASAGVAVQVAASPMFMAQDPLPSPAAAAALAFIRRNQELIPSQKQKLGTPLASPGFTALPSPALTFISAPTNASQCSSVQSTPVLSFSLEPPALGAANDMASPPQDPLASPAAAAALKFIRRNVELLPSSVSGALPGTPLRAAFAAAPPKRQTVGSTSSTTASPSTASGSASSWRSFSLFSAPSASAAEGGSPSSAPSLPCTPGQVVMHAASPPGPPGLAPGPPIRLLRSQPATAAHMAQAGATVPPSPQPGNPPTPSSAARYFTFAFPQPAWLAAT